MKLLLGCFLVLLPALVITKSVDGDHHSERVLHGKKLVNGEHEGEEGEHDEDYDHQAFLGDEAEEFDHLTPEESQSRLSAIVDKIDKVSLLLKRPHVTSPLGTQC
jgi:hypothetical protein